MSIKRTGQFLITGDTAAFTAGASPGEASFVPRRVSIMDVINFCDPTLDSHDISFVRIVLVGAGGGGGAAGHACTVDECIIWGCGGGGGGMIDISGAPSAATSLPPPTGFDGAAGLLIPGDLTIGDGGLFASPGQVIMAKNGIAGGDTVWDFGAAGSFTAGGGGGGASGNNGPGGAAGTGAAAGGSYYWDGHNDLNFLYGEGVDGGQGGTGAAGSAPSAGGGVEGLFGTGAGGVSGASLTNHSYPIFYNNQGRASAPRNLAIQNATRILSSNLMLPKYASAGIGDPMTMAQAAMGAGSTQSIVTGDGNAVPTNSVRKYATTWIVPSVLPSANTQRDWYVQQVGRGGAGSTAYRTSTGTPAGTCAAPGPTDPICGGGGAIAVFWTSYH